jgi:tetratricopeptide (TPR) repeat protein
MNERRKARKEEMYRKYVKAPIISEGLRLDSIISTPNGDFIYHYVQTIETRPKLRKVDIVLSGDIYEQDIRLYTIPKVPPLTFYISSISAFTNNTERYLTKVIERRASANTECRIAFELRKSEIKLDLGDNLFEIQKIKTTLGSLLNNETFDLDSILVSATASPEGSVATNRKLSNKRSEAVSKYFNDFMAEFKDSLITEGGVSMNIDGTGMEYTKKVHDIKFTPRSIPENWDDLYTMVQVNPDLTEEAVFSFNKIFEQHKDLDKRERALAGQPYYKYMRDSLYPRLRTVKFNFFLHRKDMVKDTIHTTVLDSTYMNGVQALRDMDYNTALALLQPYEDYNTALAYVGMDRNLSALQILEKEEKTPQVNYLLAILYSRTGDPQKAVQCYMACCKEDRSYVHRGNLDPEISVLIKTYGLNQEPEDDLGF